MPASKKPKTGPRKLTTKLKGEVLKLVRAGGHPSVALSSQIGRDLAWRWRKRADAGDEPYSTFFDELTRAEDEAEMQLVIEARIASDQQGNRKNAIALLEKRYRERWGQKITVEVQEKAIESVLRTIRDGAGEDSETYRIVLECLAGERGEEGVAEAQGDTVH